MYLLTRRFSIWSLSQSKLLANSSKKIDAIINKSKDLKRVHVIFVSPITPSYLYKILNLITWQRSEFWSPKDMVSESVCKQIQLFVYIKKKDWHKIILLPTHTHNFTSLTSLHYYYYSSPKRKIIDVVNIICRKNLWYRTCLGPNLSL